MELEKNQEKERKRVTINTLLRLKSDKKKAVWVTAYDFPTAKRADRAGVDMILVGDSGLMTVLGYNNTSPPLSPKKIMDFMEIHADAVCRGATYAFVVGDMPYMSYQPSDRDAVLNASKFISAGCSAVKCEGSGPLVASRIRAIRDAGILVQGHLGLTPQSVATFGGYVIQARTKDSIAKLVNETKRMEEAGAISILLEAVPPEAGRKVVEKTKIPIYGIGAGPYVDGQLLICHDMLGTYEGKLSGNNKIPRFAKRFANLGELEEAAFRQYANEVRSGKFPSKEQFYEMKEPLASPCKER